MQKKPHHERVSPDIKPDGLHIIHENGAQIVVPLSVFLRWCLAQLRKNT